MGDAAGGGTESAVVPAERTGSLAYSVQDPGSPTSRSEPVAAADVELEERTVQDAGDVVPSPGTGDGAHLDVPCGRQGPTSPVMWRMDPDLNSTAVTLCRVDDVVAEGAADAWCAFATVAGMGLYLADLLVSYIVIFTLVDTCKRHLGGLGLVVALSSDLGMFFYGLTLRDQSAFFWPMNFKLIPFIPLYEGVWMYRAHREWSRNDATVTMHVPRFLHSFGSMLCCLRFALFTVPQLLLTVLIRAELDGKDTPTVDDNYPEMPEGLFITALVIHSLFGVATLAYFAQVTLMPRTDTLNAFGLPRLKICKVENRVPVAGVALCTIAAYSLAIAMGLGFADGAHCGE